MPGNRALSLACLLVLGLGLTTAAPALAASPLKIREVFPGSTVLGANAEFVELQMTADGQADIDGQQLTFYDSAGSLVAASTVTIPADAALGASQRTVLLATTEAAALGGDAAGPDFALSSADRMNPAGGAVCLTGGSPGDCVTWGAIPIFPQLDPFPDRQSANAPAVADGSSLTRSIAAGCSTYLDSPDDSGSSATDFALTAPTPRHNATAPTETRCPPKAIILTFPSSPTKSASAAFTFAAIPSEPSVAFQCELDGNGSFSGPETASCDSGAVSYSSLADGQHVFQVRAKGENPAFGPTAEHTWIVDTTPPQTSILSSPPELSSGASAAFTFASSEPNSSFRCQLDDDAARGCPATGQAYTKLLDGVHTFRVWATDVAGNQDPTPATYDFTTRRSLDDITPPDTSILLTPAGSTEKSSAFFAYASSESPSSFQCSLDGASFAACPDLGASYAGLRNGTHAFAVRAVDAAGNVDPSPADYSWRVAGPLPKARIVKAPRRTVKLRNGSKKASLMFRLSSDKPGSSFRCRLDRKAFKPCRSATRLKAAAGRHRFEVYAIDALGNAGPTARWTFQVRAAAPRR